MAIKANILIFFSCAILGLPSPVLAQESLLSIVQQREQAANQNRPPLKRNTTSQLQDVAVPADYGSKAETRLQNIKRLRKLKRNDNTAIPLKQPRIRGTDFLKTEDEASSFSAKGTGKQGIGEPNPGPNVSVAAPGLPPITQTVKNKRQDIDAYAPDGVRVGNINVLPFIGAAGGYNTNPASATKAKGSPFYQVDGGLNAQSDWSTHSFSADLRGIYTDYTGVKGANQPEANARINGRIDVTRDTQIELETRAKLSTEAVSDVNLPAGVTQRPNIYTYGQSVGGSQRFGNAVLSARGSVDRSTYDAAVAGNTIIDQTDRNQNAYALRLRAGYEASPGFTPFTDVTVDTRQFDKTIDRNGFRRSSNGLTGRLGSSFELTRTLTGELALGYSTRSYADNNLKSLNGLVADADLIWSISPLTAIRLKAASELQDTTTFGASGVVNRRLGLDVEHALLRNLTLGASAEIARSSTQGAAEKQDSIIAGLRADYKLNKEVVFRTSYVFQKLSANYSGGSYTSNLVLFGLRLQR